MLGRFAMFNLGPAEITILLIVGLLVLGPELVPQWFEELWAMVQAAPGRRLDWRATSRWLWLIAAIVWGASAAVLVLRGR